VWIDLTSCCFPVPIPVSSKASKLLFEGLVHVSQIDEFAFSLLRVPFRSSASWFLSSATWTWGWRHGTSYLLQVRSK
jgi:hypothetical protein